MMILTSFAQTSGITIPESYVFQLPGLRSKKERTTFLSTIHERKASSILVTLMVFVIANLITPAVSFGQGTPAGSAQAVSGPITGEQLNLEQRIRETLKANGETIRFMENKGQIPNSNVRYYFESPAGAVYVEKDRIRFVAMQDTLVPEHEDYDEEEHGEEESHEEEEMTKAIKATHTFSLYLNGMNPNPSIRLGDQFKTNYNYFLSEDPSGWASGVKASKEITLEDVYPGIDLRLYSNSDGSMEFDWVMDAGADFSKVQMQFAGQDGLDVEADGSLKVGLRFSDVKFHIPESYQVTEMGKIPVEFAFNKINDNTVHFTTNALIDPRFPLVIDPILNWGTFMDGNDANFDAYLFAIQVDTDGSVYCTGGANRNIPTATAPYDANGYDNTVANLNGGTGVTSFPNVTVVYKISSNGADLQELTLFGNDAVDANNNEKTVAQALSLSTNRVYIGGTTNVNIPTAGTQFDGSRDGTDGFVAVFSKDLGTLQYSSYLGAGGTEALGVTTVRAISDSQFAVGMTANGALPAAYISGTNTDNTYSGTEMYIAKFSVSSGNNFNTLTYGTYVGGTDNEEFNDLEVLANGRIAFVGSTSGTNMTEVNGAGAAGTGIDGVIGVINAAGSGYNYLDRIGGSGTDRINDVEILGETLYWTGVAGTGFPTSAGAYDVTHNGGVDVVVGSVSAAGSTGYAATFYGTASNDAGSGIRVVSVADCNNNLNTFLLVFGTVGGTGMPTLNINNEAFYYASYTPGGNSQYDMFFAGFNGALTSLSYGTYMGGNQDDYLGDTGAPRGANHLWVNGSSVFLGTTTHSATHNPNLLSGFDTSKSNGANDSHIILGIQFNSITETDYSDASNTYGVPAHIVDCVDLHIGTTIDAEAAALPTALANGDDLNGSDDEDAVTTLPSLTPGGPQNISVTVVNITNTIGSTANVYGWIDFDGDGAFEASEFASNTVATGQVNVSRVLSWTGVTVSGGANSHFMRIRITTNALVDAGGTPNVDERSTLSATNGEVEDYLLSLNCPTSCTITGGPGGTICPNTQATFGVTISGCQTPTYSWSLINNTSNATIVGSSTAATVTVSAGTNCGAYTIRSSVACSGCVDPIVCTQTVNVVDATPPVITCATQTTPINCPTTPTWVTPTATDACDATVAITFTTTTTQGSCAGTYSQTRTWTATDDCGNTATCSRTIVVQDVTPPTITCATQTTPINCPAVPTWIPPAATDACDATVAIAFADATTQGSCAGTYSVTRTWTATDDCGNTASCSRTIVVRDITPPTITCATQTTPISCPAVPTWISPTATDACDATVAITFVDATTQGSCSGTYTVTRTWTATDDCGNTASCNRAIVVRDITPPTITCAIQTSPINCPAVPAFVTPTATDACDATVTISFTDATTQGSCAGTYTVTRTWTATDDCSNTASCSASIVVRDNTSPTITCATQTTPINCPATPVWIAPTATDACDATVAITFTDATTQGSCAGTYTVTRTWTATDDCGNTASCNRAIVVRDITPPTITCATQTTPIDCPATPVWVSPTATDACDATVVITFTDATTQGSCAGTYTVTRTWTATDDCGNTASCNRAIVVRDITPPTITCATQTSPIDCPAVPVFIPPTATDACDATVTITFVDATTQGSCAGTYTVTRTWTATDDCGNTASCNRAIVVRDITPPTITCATQTSPINCPAVPVFISPTATDACDATVSLTFTDATTQGSCAGTYTVTRTWTATDDCGNTASCNRAIVVRDITPPTITCAIQTSPINCPAVPVFVAPTATDACDATVTISFTDATTQGSCAGTYTVTRTWTATDDCGNTATCSASIVVRDNTPPTITCATQTTPINCPATPVWIAPTATDACDATVAITFTDATTQGSCAGTYTVTRTWTATDDCGNTASCNRAIVVRDITPPTITCATQTTPIDCPATPVWVSPTATDACDATVVITFTDATTQGSCAGTYTVTRTWTATDDCGNTASCNRAIVVRDITPPTITCATQTTPIDCPATPVWVSPTATDACDATVVITFTDATTQGSCAGTYTVTRTWTATDDCGNTASCNRTIVVRDITPPTITCATQTTPINCPAVPIFIAPTVTDACDATVAITFIDATTPGSCAGTYSVTRTWTATDDCGNAATCNRTIVVRDITPPTCATQNITVSVNPVTGTITITPSQVNNGSSDLCSAVTLGVAPSTFSCSDAGPNVVTLTVTDACGNSSSCTATVTIVGCADLTLSKTVNNSTPNVGEVVTFTITVSNSGPNAATNVGVGDVIPNGYAYVAGSIAGGTTQSAAGVPTLAWTIASIANGGSAILTFQATVLAPGAGVLYLNHAEVTVSNQYDPDSQPDPTPDADPPTQDDEDTEPVTPQVADLSLIKTVSNSTPNVGDVVTFTITVSNAGPNTATNVAVGDVLPNGYAYVAGSIAGGTTQNASGIPILAWTIASIANGGNAVLTFQATVLAGGGVLYLNHAEVTASNQYDPDSQPDPTPDGDAPTQDDEDTEPVTPQGADLSLIKTVSNASPNVGDVVTFTITVSNAGPNAATGVAVDDVIPNGYAYVAGSITGGTTQNAGGAPMLIWTIASIANGGSAILTFQATVLAPIAGRTYANVARVTASNQYDPDSSPNNAADSSPGNGIGSADADGTQDPADEDDGDDAVTTPQVADLSLIKTVSNSTPNVGSIVTFTITVNNAGPNTATNVAVGDVIPNGYSYVGGSIAGGTTQNASGVPTLAWTIASIANGGNAVLTFQATVLAPGAGVLYLNHAEVTASTQYDPDSQPDSTPDADPPTQDDEDTEPVTPQVADLSLIKTVNNAAPNVGDVVTFSITVSNAGPNTATGVAVDDVIPNGYAYVVGSIAGGTTQNAGGAPTLLWTIASIANGSSAVLTFQATVLAPIAGRTYANVARVTASNQYDPDSSPNNAADSSPGNGIGSADADGTQDPADEDDGDDAVTTPQVADLSLTKTVNNSTPNVGSIVTFTITVNNAGPNTGTNVGVGDVIPNGYAYVAGSIAGGTTQNASGVPTLAWTIASIANGGSAVLTFQATVLAPGGGVSYLNHAEVTVSNQYDPDSQPDPTPDADPPTQDDEDTEPVTPQVADLSLIKTVNNSTPNVGDVVTFTITVNNAGPNAATNVAVGDVLPNGYAYVAGSIAGGTTQNASGAPILAWTIASIANGGNAVLTFQATVLAPGGVSYLNHAEITASNQYDPDSQPDPTPDGDTPTQDDEDSEPVTPIQADLSLVKIVSNSTPNVGDVVTFTITVSNAGPNTATNVGVGDVIPNGYAYVAGSIAGGTTQNASGVPTLAWTIASIANSGSAVLTFQATVLAPGGGVSYLNHAEVTSSNEYDPDSQPDATPDADAPTQDDEDTEPVTPIQADLSLVKTVSNSTPNVGDVVTFTITVSNAGPNTATNVGVGDVIPNGYAYVAGSIAGGTTQSAAGVPTLAWTIASIANGGSAVLTFQVTVLAPGGGVSYLNHAEVTASNQYDPDSQPDATPDADSPTQDDEDTEPVIPQMADLSLTKTVSNSTPNVGSIVTFTIAVNNAGPNTATNVAVGDVIPNGYAYVAGSIAGGTTQNASGVPTLAWTIASIANGGNAVLTFQATVLAPGAGVLYLNHAEVTASTQYDPDSQPDSTPDADPPTQDDEDTEPVTPQVADLSLIKTVSNPTPNVGDVVTFTLTVNNAGPNTATNVTVGDVIPNGYAYVAGSIAGGTTQNAGGVPILMWSIASIANGGSAVLTFQATVLPLGVGVSYVNHAEVTHSDQFDPDSQPDPTPDSDAPVQDDEDDVTVLINCGTCNVINGPADPVCPGSVSVFTAQVTGACNNPVYTWTVTGNVASSTPNGATISVTAGNVCGQTYTVSVSIVCQDCGSSPIICSDVVLVNDVIPPTIICMNQTTPINCPSVPVFIPPTATDACDATVAITFTDATTQGSCAGAYSVTRTWTATDDCGNTATCSRTIVVRDITPPTITCLVQTSPIYCPAVPVFNPPTATDACDATVAITFTDATTPGSCAGIYNVTRTWTATDDCGNTATCSRAIVVSDLTSPVCSTQDITVDVDQLSGFVTITPSQVNNGSMDACNSVTLAVTPSTFTCDNIGPNLVTLTVTDLCGNASTCSATVTVNSCYDPCVNVNAWVYLEGSVTDPSGVPVYTLPMRTSLNNLHVLPGQTLMDPFFGSKYTPPGQPYDTAPWNYLGNEGSAFDSGGNPVPGTAGYPSTVVDWVLVSLRADSAGTDGPVCQAAALLHKNGYIQFVEPFDCCDLDLFEPYYVVIEHRNHLIIMSETPVPIVPGIDSSTITYDFRTQQSYVNDPFMIGIFARQKELLPQLPGVYAMYAGNGNQINTNFSDTDINFDDRTYWEGENGQIGEYKIGDYNLNGDTNFNDRVTWERNNGKFTSVPRN